MRTRSVVDDRLLLELKFMIVDSGSVQTVFGNQLDESDSDAKGLLASQKKNHYPGADPGQACVPGPNDLIR